MKVRYTKRAQRDLEAILHYLNERSPSGSSSVATSIGEAVDQLADYPGAGRETTREALRVRVVRGYPYLVFYKVGPEHVSIVHIRHAARRPYA
jgi:toxin ParE1/3/4